MVIPTAMMFPDPQMTQRVLTIMLAEAGHLAYLKKSRVFAMASASNSSRVVLFNRP
jgi:hypothetical protein